MGLTPSGLVSVTYPYDAVTHAQLRKIQPKGTWSGVKKHWEFPFAAAEILTNTFGSRFQIQEELAEWLRWLKHPLPPLPRHKELIQKADLSGVLVDGRVPFHHQRVGARWLLARRGALLADEMGLGKTLTVLLAARAMARCSDVRILVVAPVSLHAHWRKEADSLDLQIKLESWAKLPHDLPPAGTLLIVDEAHFAQSLYAQRTQALLRLARHPRLRAIWMLSGTPIKNGRPAQLYPLLAAIDHPLAYNQRRYEEYFCQGHWQETTARRIWNCKGASNLKELRRLLKPMLLKRTKEKLLSLPPKIRIEHPITLKDAQARGFDHRINLIVDNYRERVRNGLVKSDAESFAFLTAIRQISSEFKLPFVSNLLKELNNKGEAVVVFSAFINPLKFLHNCLGGELLTGQQPLKAREIAVNRFQEGNSLLLFATYGTGGLGFTLHRARHVVLLERPWTPGDAEQAEDRCHRIGMRGVLTTHWYQLGFGDQLVDQLISNKSEKIKILMGHKNMYLKRDYLPILIRGCVS